MLMWSKAKWPAQSDVTAKVSLQYFVAIGRSRVVIRDGVDQGDRERRKSSRNNSPHGSVQCSQVDQSQHESTGLKMYSSSRVSPCCLHLSVYSPPWPSKQPTNTITASWNLNLGPWLVCPMRLAATGFYNLKAGLRESKTLIWYV